MTLQFALVFASVFGIYRATGCSPAEITAQLLVLEHEMKHCAKAVKVELKPPPTRSTPSLQLVVCAECGAIYTKVAPFQWPRCMLVSADREPTFTAFVEQLVAPPHDLLPSVPVGHRVFSLHGGSRHTNKRASRAHVVASSAAEVTSPVLAYFEVFPYCLNHKPELGLTIMDVQNRM
jgi:hypothetical protein